MYPPFMLRCKLYESWVQSMVKDHKRACWPVLQEGNLAKPKSCCSPLSHPIYNGRSRKSFPLKMFSSITARLASILVLREQQDLARSLLFLSYRSSRILPGFFLSHLLSQKDSRGRKLVHKLHSSGDQTVIRCGNNMRAGVLYCSRAEKRNPLVSSP